MRREAVDLLVLAAEAARLPGAGHRLMLVAGYFPGPEGPTPAQIDEMTKVAEGATFVDADQVGS